MSDDALRATMKELDAYLELRSEHRTNIDAATDALVKLEGEIVRLREQLLGHLHDYALGDFAPPESAAGLIPLPPIGERRREKARKAGLASAARLTPEQRKERSRKANAARHVKGPPQQQAAGPKLGKPALKALETIKASNGEGVPSKTVPAWVLAVLKRYGYAKKLPNGNWVAA